MCMLKYTYNFIINMYFYLYLMRSINMVLMDFSQYYQKLWILFNEHNYLIFYILIVCEKKSRPKFNIKMMPIHIVCAWKLVFLFFSSLKQNQESKKCNNFFLGYSKNNLQKWQGHVYSSNLHWFLVWHSIEI